MDEATQRISANKILEQVNVNRADELLQTQLQNLLQLGTPLLGR
jgi:hypothetical protein